MVKYRLLQLSLPLVPLALCASAARSRSVAGPPHAISATDATSRTSIEIARGADRITYAMAVPVRSLEVWVSNWDGTDNRHVTWAHDDVQNGNPSITSDGNTVYMFAQTAMNNKQHRIWKVDLATAAGTQMTQPGDPAPGVEHDVFPSVSPDATKLLFNNRRRNSYATVWRLFAMRNEPESATNVPVQVTHTPVNPMSNDAINARWTADSKYILFERGGPTGSIYVVDPADADNDGYADNPPVDLLPGKPSSAKATFPSQSTVDGSVYFLYTDTPGARPHVFSGDLKDAGTPAARLENIRQIVGSDGFEAAPAAAGNRLAWVAVDDSTPTAKKYTVVGADLANDATPGTLSGRITFTDGTTADQVTVLALNGTTEVQRIQPDSNGAFTITLPPGGYTIRIETPAGVTSRGVTIYPGGEISLSGEAAPKPRGVLATIQPDASVSVRFQPIAPKPFSGYVLSGLNVYRATSEAGPWTKLTATPLTPTETMEYLDAAPPDLTKAFYTVTAVTSSGTETVESDYAVVGQAANNLAFNPSFEQMDNGSLAGWQNANAGANRSTGGADSAQHVSGSRAAFIQGESTRLDAHLLQAQPYWMPVANDDAYVSGVYAKFVNAPLAGYVSTRHAIAGADPHQGKILPGFMDDAHNTTQLAGGQDNAYTTWNWLSNTTGFGFPENATYTRMSAYWATTDAALGGEQAWFDDIRFQVRRVGATGILSGRVVDAAGTPVSGAVATTSTGQSGISGWPYGQFVIRDVPTGTVDVTVSAAPATPVTVHGIRNIGGYQFPDTITLDKAVPLVLSGKISLPNGGAASGADVSVIQLGADLFTETRASAAADAEGRYQVTAPAPAQPGDSFWIVALKGGYQSAFTPALGNAAPMDTQPGLSFGAVGGVTVNLTLGRATPIIQVARTDTPPVVDGLVNETAWQKSQEITGFFQYLSPNAPFTPSTKAYALWDNANLYVAVVADEPNSSGIVDAASGQDNPDVFTNDHVSLYLDPVPSAAFGHGREAWQLAANLNPTIATVDGLLETRPMFLDLSTSAYMDNVAGLQVAANRNDAGQKWSMEFKIPFADLSSPFNTGLTVTPPVEGDEWRGLLARFRPQGADASNQNGNTAFATKPFAQAHQWNTLRFVNTPAPVRGDLNDDSLVTLADAGAALRITAGLEPLGGRAAAGDVYGADGAITLGDALRIARYITGADPSAL